MSTVELINFWKHKSRVNENIVTWHTTPSRDAQWFPFPDDLNQNLFTTITNNHIHQLYLHQHLSYEAINNMKNVVITTGTASGKSLCYNLPILNTLIKNPTDCALYLFPTKALSQDQFSKLQSLIEIPEIKYDGPFITDTGSIPIAIYDGDTPTSIRKKIKTHARIILTNPDMLHVGILPQHTQWVNIFRNLKFVVIDEIHLYRGVFGSHVANVIRRLKRVSSHYKSKPIFIMTSATIANAKQHAEALIEENVDLITDDGSPKEISHFLIYNPPVINKNLGIRRSAIQESVQLTMDLINNNVQTIIFGRSRKTIEFLLITLKNNLSTIAPVNFMDNPSIIRGYRSGYLPSKRREIEQQLRKGIARVIVATNALELGIDIGELEAVIILGFPGTISSTRQQAGRVGRKLNQSIALFIASGDPIDQYICNHPEFLFSQQPEHALINPDNLHLLLDHIRCATYELPFTLDDNNFYIQKDLLNDILNLLCEANELIYSGNKYIWMNDKHPAHTTSLRNLTAEKLLLNVKDNGSIHTIGQVDRISAFWLVHPGAIYFHESESYLVEELNLDTNSVFLNPISNDYYTEPISHTSIKIIDIITQSNQINLFGQSYLIRCGEILVSKQVIGFKKILLYSHEIVKEEALDLPAVDLNTNAYWFSLPDAITNSLRNIGAWNNDSNRYGNNWRKQRKLARERDHYQCKLCGSPECDQEHDVHHLKPFKLFDSYIQANEIENLITLCPTCHRQVEVNVRIRSGLAGLGYILIHIAPLFLMCDQNDIGIESSTKFSFCNGEPAILIYEQHPGGIGFSQKLFEIHDTLIKASKEVVSTCQCKDGCPSCVGPGGENGIGGKNETLALLNLLST